MAPRPLPFTLALTRQEGFSSVAPRLVANIVVGTRDKVPVIGVAARQAAHGTAGTMLSAAPPPTLAKTQGWSTHIRYGEKRRTGHEEGWATPPGQDWFWPPSNGGQSTGKAYTHAQCSPGQGTAACSAAIKNYIDSNLQMAKQIGDENGLVDSALTYFMKAGHSLMDMGSPTHTAADGTPTTWPGLGPTHWFDDLTHIMGEHDEAQDWYGMGRSVCLMVAAFFQAFPEEASQKLGTIGGATQRAVESIVSRYYAGPDESGQNAIREDAARICALGNRAACDH